MKSNTSKYISFILSFCIGLFFALPTFAEENVEIPKDTLSSDSVALQKKKKGDYHYVIESKPTEKDTNMFFSWKSFGPLGTPAREYADTTLERLYVANVPEKKTIAYADHASLGSPGLSLIYFDREKKSDFVFMRPYELSYVSNKDIYYYNTKKPLSRFTFIGAGPSNRSDVCVGGLFTVNANRKLNFGMFGDWVNSYGAYESSSTRNCNAGFFSSYMGRRSNLMMSIGFTKFENYENGGVTDENIVQHPEENGNLSEENIPVNFIGNTFSKLHGYNMYLNYKYHIGFDKEIKLSNDSVEIDYIPITSIIVDAKYESDWKRYNERVITDAHNNYYGIDNENTFRNLNNKMTLDSVMFRQLRMNIGLTLNEEFNKLMRFGLGAYYIIDYKAYHYTEDRLMYSEQDEVFLKENKIDENLTDSMGYFARPLWGTNKPMKMGIGATLSKHSGEHFFYNVLGEYYFLDEKKTGASFLLKGDLLTKFRQFNIGAEFSLENRCPDYFMEHYYSNYLTWNNDFENEREMRIKGHISFDSKERKNFGSSTYAKIGYANLGNHICVGMYAKPIQLKEANNILNIGVGEKLRFWWFTWNNEICYQESSDEVNIPLPRFSWYSNFYVKTPTIFKNSLTLQLGVDCRYYTKYYAQAYMPATGMFYSQAQKEYGGYPLLNAYAMMQLKVLQFYAVWNHLNREMGDNRNYISSPGYPMNASFVRIGIAVSFDD